jgi:phospholipid/cholesterol/gamma-HCH transport system permease protein
MAAEIGTMRVTEQIDALQTLSTNPFRYLVFPRILAGLFMLPFLVLIADIIGVFGGYLVAVYKLGFNPGSYLTQTLKNLTFDDVYSGLIKAGAFGIIITLMGCYNGYQSKRGAEGVGRATINAVVSSSILILFMNYALTSLLFKK